MTPRFCTACGAGLAPGGAFCPACGTGIQRTAPPAPPSAPVLGDPASPEVQPGEIELGSWTVNHPAASGALVNGRLIVTSHRLLFRPMTSGVSLYRMLRSQMSRFKAEHMIVLARDRIAAVRTDKGFLKKNVLVTTVDGTVLVFNCGPRSMHLIAQMLGGSDAG